MNGAEYTIEFLRGKGVTESFGYPGGQVLTLYDAIYQYQFPHTVTRHEQGAVHAAEGYARATGRTGVVIATSGPGATNLVTGIADAYLDSTPLFIITGQVASGNIGKDAFQEADISGITIPITKNNYLVKFVDDLPRILEEAWMLVTNGRHGPVLVDIAKDVFAAEMPESVHKRAMIKPYTPKPIGEETLKQCVKAFKKARKPLILAGGGANRTLECSELLNSLASSYHIPGVNTLMGKGAWRADAPYYMGMVGMHGHPAANIALRGCDLLLTLGFRYSDRVVGKPAELRKDKTIIQVGIDNAEFSKTMAVDISVQADAADFLKVLLKKLEGEKDIPSYTGWLADCQEIARKYPLRFDKTGKLKPQEVIAYVADHIKKDCAVVTDVGQHQMFAAQYFPVSRPNRFITSGGLGTMGFGIPAAMGAAMGTGDVACLFVGDGGFQMTLQELAVISHKGLPVKIFILDNSCLGMVRQWQELFYGQRYSHSISSGNPDFVALAKAYRLNAFQLSSREELDRLDGVLNTPEPVLIHCIVDERENVYPMIPPGGGVFDMTGPDGLYE